MKNQGIYTSFKWALYLTSMMLVMLFVTQSVWASQPSFSEGESYSLALKSDDNDTDQTAIAMGDMLCKVKPAKKKVVKKPKPKKK
jgi:hypothetical protein